MSNYKATYWKNDIKARSTSTMEEITPDNDVVVSETVDIDVVKDVDETIKDENKEEDANKNENDEPLPLIENKDENTENNEIKTDVIDDNKETN